MPPESGKILRTHADTEIILAIFRWFRFCFYVIQELPVD